MGTKRLVDKTVKPLAVPTTLSPATITARAKEDLGVIPIGVYKGTAAFWDLDKAVNQPLVAAEGFYSLDKLDTRDGLAIAFNVPDLIGVTRRARTTAVPAGEVWYINRIVLVSPAALVAEAIQLNFRISTWVIPDVRAGLVPDADGRAYWPADQGTIALNTYTVDLPAQGELGAELRLPAGGVITLVATLTAGNASGLLTATLNIFGRKGRLMVA